MRLYRKDDKTRRLIVMIIGVILAVFISIWIIGSLDSIILSAILAFIINVVLLVVLQYFFVLKRVQQRLNSMMQSGLMTLDYNPLREEMKLINDAYDKNPKSMKFYSTTLFSAYRITDGKAAEKFIDPIKGYLKNIKRNEFIKANFTIELCYYYLTIDDIEMFLLAVKKLKSYHYTTFEKLSRKFEKLAENVNHNEYKELAFIGKLYTNGVDEVKIEKLLSNPLPLYRMIYTFFILNYYKSCGDEEKVKEYTLQLEQFEGNAYPLKRNDKNEI